MLKKLIFVTDRNYVDVGLLIVRIGLGIMFMLHGWGKITGGTEKWQDLGESVNDIGIYFGYTFWGFMAAYSEFFGGTMLAMGLFTRANAFLLFFTMLVASVGHIAEADAGIGLRKTLLEGSHAIEAAFVFLAFLFIGPGKYSLDAKIFKMQQE